MNPGEKLLFNEYLETGGESASTLKIFSDVASPNIQSRYANFFVFIDYENNKFLKK